MQNDVLKGWLSFTPKMRPCQGVPVGGGGGTPLLPENNGGGRGVLLCSLKIMWEGVLSCSLKIMAKISSIKYPSDSK